ncbi:MAG: N-acetyltransferase [Chloroflexota bacterium]|nr:N-acetyltransferase [Chloroflexota bacterium]
MTELTVRPERPADLDQIRAVNEAAFGRPVEARIVDALRGTDRWLDGGSIVAELSDGTIVGHLLLSEGDLEFDDGRPARRIWLLGPVAVTPAWQRRGIGAALMHDAIALAARRGQPLVCLLGHADYYPRFGFESARAIGIEPPAAWPEESWLALRLPAWSADLRGRARYPSAFDDESRGANSSAAELMQ